jgi:8-oxo-dGTP diphosphatase
MVPNGVARHSVSVAGVVQDEAGRVLLIQRADNGQWEIPGGVVELGEELLDALVREVRDETGVTIVPKRLTGIYQNMTVGVVALVFECGAVGGAPRPSDESLQVAYVDPERLPDLVGDRIRVRIDDALSRLLHPVIRAHSHPSTEEPRISGQRGPGIPPE